MENPMRGILFLENIPFKTLYKSKNNLITNHIVVDLSWARQYHCLIITFPLRGRRQHG